MRTIPAAMQSRWDNGGPFYGLDGRVNGYVTVEPDWYLTETSAIATPDTTKLPFRWFQSLLNDQTEVVIPGVKTIVKDRTLDSDAGTCTITMSNVKMGSNTGNPGGVGQVGYYSWDWGSPAANARWGQVANSWSGVLIPNALLRTYQGYGGWVDADTQKPLATALADGDVILTGMWLIDDVTPRTDGTITITCRDMFKLLIEQPIYPLLVPYGWYPLHYYRFWEETQTRAAIPVYDSTDPIESGPGAEGPKYVPDVAIAPDSQGYIILGSDGGIFPFGPSGRGWGTRGGDTDDSAMVGIAMEPTNRGFWLTTAGGGVFAFGDCDYLGGAFGSTTSPVVAIRAHPDGEGYWQVEANGTVHNFGSAQHFGDNPVGSTDIVDLQPTPTGLGYWLLSDQGQVYTYGDALYYGNGAAGIDPSVGMAVRSDGLGYWIAHVSGEVDALGAAEEFPAAGDWEEDPGLRVLNDPIFNIEATATNNGYLLVGGDGGIFTFGDAPFFGSLPGGGTYSLLHDGNYLDYRDIVKDLLRWGGFLAYGDGGDAVYGLLEATGAYSKESLPRDMFDKKPLIDPLKQIKEVVGYHLWCDDEGRARFQQPNWYAVGNVMENGIRVATILEIDERIQLVSYEVPYHDRSTRDQIIIASADPATTQTGFVSTVKTLTSPLLRGMKRPAMWINGALTDFIEQQRMVELIARHIEFSYRPGTFSCWCNPAIQINDQVRVYERQTAETAIRYVKGIRDEMNIEKGTWLMTGTTFWLGEPDDFVLV